MCTDVFSSTYHIQMLHFAGLFFPQIPFYPVSYQDLSINLTGTATMNVQTKTVFYQYTFYTHVGQNLKFPKIKLKIGSVVLGPYSYFFVKSCIKTKVEDFPFPVKLI